MPLGEVDRILLLLKPAVKSDELVPIGLPYCFVFCCSTNAGNLLKWQKGLVLGFQFGLMLAFLSRL